MTVSAKTLRTQLNILKPILAGRSLKTVRKGQDKIGELMELKCRGRVIVKKHRFDGFEGAWALPQDERRQGVVLYLHGGGYCCGGIDYASGVASMLAENTGTRVFCAAYRLAPEHPYPAALEDALEAYNYIISKGYPPDRITLCGESAGGGLCFALCMKLREQGIDMPCGLIAISPWTDLTASGESYETNKQADPSITKELLGFYADCYTQDRINPLASPLFGDLGFMPPSLIFAGGDEIMLSDAMGIHQRLLEHGRQSKLIVRENRWHAYILYGLDEDKNDLSEIDAFLSRVMSKEKKLRWLRLDNAAKIYPAARRQNWSNVFRLSATLKEKIDVDIMQSALDVTLRRFPSIAVKLKKGVFWYYLQQLSQAPAVREEYSYPLTRMSKNEMRSCAFRVIVYDRRVAVELFHSLTDGGGAMVFLKSLTAEYLQQKYGVYIPAEKGVLGRLEEPKESEIEDSFQKYGGSIAADRRENTAYRLSGTPETGGFLHLTCFDLSSAQVKEKAASYGVTVTCFLCAVMMDAIQRVQKEKVSNPRRRKPIKVLIPVDLRRLFDSRTLRNFAMYTTPEILPALGEYGFEEICKIVHHRMGMDITPKQMSMKIAVNVNSERLMAVRVMPLFIKNIVMKAIFDSVGERKSCLSLSNLGQIKLPDSMAEHVERMDFILGVQASAPHNCGVLSYGGRMYINFIRNIKESRLEYHFFKVLQDLGIDAQVQSNWGEKEG